MALDETTSEEVSGTILAEMPGETNRDDMFQPANELGVRAGWEIEVDWLAPNEPEVLLACFGS